MLVGDILLATAKRYPEKIGLVDAGREYPWREVNARVNGLAHGLLGLGLNKGDRVAILCGNCHYYLEFYFACAKTGLVALPLNTWLKAGELSHPLDLSGARALVVDAAHRETAAKLRVATLEYYIGCGEAHGYTLDFETLLRENPQTEPPQTGPEAALSEDDIFVLSFTSGTTGLPKEAVITHRNACAAVWRMALDFRIRHDSVYLLHAPMFFTAGGGGRFPCILRGCRVIVTSYDAAGMLQIIEKERVTHLTGSPTPIKRLVEHPDAKKRDLSSVRVVGLTGGVHGEAEIRAIELAFGHVWYSSWGMTETCACGTILPPEEVALEGPLAARLGSIGRAQDGLEFRAVKENGDDVNRDGLDVGELICRGDVVIGSYWRDPEETTAALRDGWLHTGDMVVIDADGYIYIVDRKKDIIISGGINIAARELEELIATHDAVAQCAVVAVPHDDWGETPRALVVLKDGRRATAEEIIGLCRDNLAAFKKPTSVEFVDHLPLTASGKVNKAELRERYC